MSAKIVGVFVTLVVASASMWAFRYEIGDMMAGERDIIVAHIKLDNQCEIDDHVFIARDLTTGKYASFAGGRAKLRTRERNRVTVEFAPRFTEVEYYSPVVPVKADMVMTTQCDSQSILNMNWFK